MSGDYSVPAAAYEGNVMIDFEEELRKFKPSLEIDRTEDHEEAGNDMVDLMIELMSEYREER